MKAMKDYHDLHLKCDILLLADVFEKFRNNSLKNYGLCPSHYLNLNLLQILKCIYSLRKAQELERLIFLIDIAKRTISI